MLEDPFIAEVHKKKEELENKRTKLAKKLKHSIKHADYEKRGYLTLPLLHLMLQEIGLLSGFSDFMQHSSD